MWQWIMIMMWHLIRCDIFFIITIMTIRCENGTESIGCGPQEEFRACADLAIHSLEGKVMFIQRHLRHFFFFIQWHLCHFLTTMLSSFFVLFSINPWGCAVHLKDGEKILFDMDSNVRWLQVLTFQLWDWQKMHHRSVESVIVVDSWEQELTTLCLENSVYSSCKTLFTTLVLTL